MRPRKEITEVHIPLWATSYQIAQGHSIRISVSCRFPRLWPTRTNPCRLRVLFSSTPRHTSRKSVSHCCPPALVSGPAVTFPDSAVNRTPLLFDFTPRWKVECDLATATVRVLTGQYLFLSTPQRDGRITLDHNAQALVCSHVQTQPK